MYRHIIAEKRENIPKFGKLDDIASPFRRPELFFDDVLVVMIVGYTKRRDRRQTLVFKLLMKKSVYS